MWIFICKNGHRRNPIMELSAWLELLIAIHPTLRPKSWYPLISLIGVTALDSPA